MTDSRATRTITAGSAVLALSTLASGWVVAADEAQLEEVVVTAQKRVENLQSVPIAVTALSSSDLLKSGPATSQDLNELVSGLNIQRSGQDTQLKIRGIGTENEGVGDEASVAVYVDNVYQPISKGDVFHFSDVERVEVLKGPQGTLFGRNATGGLINIVTRTPSLTESSGDFTASYSRFNTPEFTAYLSGPVSSAVAAGLAAFYTHSDGYLHDPNKPGVDISANDAYGVRAKVIWEAATSAHFTFGLDASRASDPAPYEPTIVDNSSIFEAVSGTAPFILSSRPYQAATSYIPLNISKDFGASIQGTFNLEHADLITITGVRRSSNRASPDPDISPFDLARLDFTEHLRSASEDLRLQSSDAQSKFQWTVGLFGYWSQDRWDNYTLTLEPLATGAPIPLVNYILFPKVDTQAYAAYGQGSYQITDRLSASVGLRYSTEHKSDIIHSADTGVLTTYPLVQGAARFNNFSPKITLQYSVAQSSMVYASWGKGFKSGILNPLQIQDVAADGTPTPQDGAKVIQPEKITSVEVGFKTDLARQLRANVSLFQYKYKDLQNQITTPSSTGNIIENIGAATLRGMDADFLAKFSGLLLPDDRLELKAGIAYLNARYDSYPNASTYFYNGPAQGLTLGTIPDAAGNTMTRAPKWTEGLNVDYGKQTRIGNFDLIANVYHSSTFFYDAANTPRFAQPSFSKLNLALNWESLDGHETVSLWGKNITDQLTFQTTYTLALAEAKRYYPPATFGITVGYHF